MAGFAPKLFRYNTKNSNFPPLSRFSYQVSGYEASNSSQTETT